MALKIDKKKFYEEEAKEPMHKKSIKIVKKTKKPKKSKKPMEKVATVMKEFHKGNLNIGKSDKKVTNPKQAIAIGLSEARKKGAKIPKKRK